MNVDAGAEQVTGSAGNGSGVATAEFLDRLGDGLFLGFIVAFWAPFLIDDPGRRLLDLLPSAPAFG